jgi:tryptophan synthase beta chain
LGGGAPNNAAGGGAATGTNDPYKIYLEESEIPSAFYNVRADMDTQHAPILHPGTLKPIVPADLEPVFCTELVKQELDTTNRYLDIPGPLMDFYRMYRPSPLVRAYCLEKELDTPARIYYKYEGGNTSGSHKLNSAIAQAYYAKEQGLEGLTTETGAGQWGTALAMACAYFDLGLEVFMVRGSYEQKPYRKTIIQTYGASITASPSTTTNIGRKMSAELGPGEDSLGTAISEAVEVAVGSGGTKRYALGSVLNQVLLHQSIIGLEAKAALDKLGVYPDVVIGSAGGGSNLGGLMAPFMADRLTGRAAPYFIAVEPASCPSLTRGRFAYDFCDTGEVTPLAKMYTLGHAFMPAATHAGGLRYHGMSPILSQLYHGGFLDEARAVEQTDVFDAAVRFARSEGTLPAPESAHAIYVAIQEALACRESGEAKTILFGLTGNGLLDLGAYEQYLAGTMTDFIPTDEDLERGFASIPSLPGIQ